MISLPPVLVVLDLSALMTSKTREWQEFSRVGQCYVPQVVLEAVQFLADRGGEAELEQTAKEFSRFYPTSGWQITAASASHPTLQPTAGASVSKKSRLSLAVAECVCGLAQLQPKALVMLVADQSLLQRIQGLKMPNLCGISMPALLQWSRTQRRPPLISHHLLLVNSSTTPAATTSHSANRSTPAPSSEGSRVTAPSRPSSSRSTLSPPIPSTAIDPAPRRSRSISQFSVTNSLSQLISGILALTALAFIVSVGWSVFQPATFQQFWHKTGLPALPGQSPRSK